MNRTNGLLNFIRYKGYLKVLCTSFLVVGTSGCLEDPGNGGGGSNPSEDCSKPFEKVIYPVEIKGHRHMYFDIDEFDFLFTKNLRIEDISIEGTFDDHKDDDPEDFSVSINGIKSNRRDGGRCVEVEKKKDKKERRFYSKAHKFFLNGSEPFHLFLAKIKLRKGELKLSVDKRKEKIIDARIVVRGKIYEKCENPPPPPPPPAVAPKTTITSVNPSGALVNSANISFAFSADQTNVTFTCQLDNGPAASCVSPQNYAGLSNGPHTFKVFATNAAGLSDANAPVHNWVVDTEPPTVIIDNLASLPTLTKQTSMTFEFSSTEAGTFTCSLDGAAGSSCTSPLTVSNLGEGSHRIDINIVDNAGNASESPASFQWVVDTTAPVTSIVSVTPALQYNNSSTISFQFAANESASFECSVDNNAFSSCVSPLNLENLAEGSHWFEVRATDVAGNVGFAASYNWAVDLTAPVISLGNVLPALGLTNSPNISVDFSVSEVAEVNCSLDGVETKPCTSPFTAIVDTEGAHSLVISAVDSAGNVSGNTVLNWNMDFTLPTITFGAFNPSASAYLNVDSLSVEVIPSEEVTFTSRLNGVDLGQSQSPLALAGLPEGAYVLEVTGLDAAGNPANTISHSFSVDLTAPIVNLVSAVPALTNLDSNTLTFTAAEAVNFFCNIDGSGFAPCASPHDLSGLADGEHVAQVKAVDLALNEGPIASVIWVVDTTAPLINIVANFSAENVVTFNLSANEDVSDFLCSIDNAVQSSCNSSITYTLGVGPHSFTARAVDIIGNVGPGETYNFVVRDPINTTSLFSNRANLTNFSDVTFNFTANHADAAFRCSLDGSAEVVCLSGQSYNGLADGSHTFTVRAVDKYGNQDATPLSHTWTIDTIAPSTSLTAQFLSNNTIRFNLTSNEPGTFECSVDGGAYSACAATVTLTLAQGNHTFAARSRDAAGNLDTEGASHAFTVRPPITVTLVGASQGPVTNQTSISFTFTSNHADAVFRCSLDGAAATPCSSPISYSSLANGAHTFLVYAIDSFGTASEFSAGYNWTVDTIAPTVVTHSFTATSTTIRINWTTSEPATSRLLWGPGSDTSRVVPDDGVLKTSHSVLVTGLTPNTMYSFRPAGQDQAGNQYAGGPFTARTNR